MPGTTFERLTEDMPLHEDLIDGLDEATLIAGLPVPSNTIWDQLWCVVGGRESYAGAIAAGQWTGFSCSLSAADRGSKAKLAAALQSSRGSMEEAGASAPESPFVLEDLLHETQHQGQLIRFMYGLELPFPDSWQARWSI